MSNDSTGKAIHGDLQRLREVSDEDIDLSHIPELGDEWFAKAEWQPPRVRFLRLRLDPATSDYYESQGEAGTVEAADVLREHAARRRANS